tara:strand:+ start:1418 stop:2140 length:723 start_codon:yes stop_codon:yes gene_type:complete
MAAVTAAVAGTVGSAVVKGIGAKKASRRAGRKAAAARRAISDLEANRQDVINPFDNMEGVADMAENLSGMMSNPMANLGVATQAAEMQAEEADIALANTLDTLRATGAGAGGATALAQMALKSKQGISASIQQQEAQNQKLRAQGEQNLQQRQVAEEQRVQGVEMNDAIRLQNAESQGRAFEFNTQESRDNTKLSRLYGQQANADANQAQARASGVNALAGGLSGVGNLATSGAFGEFPG